MRRHVRHHGRFYAAAVVGALAGLVPWPTAFDLRLLLAGDTFFLVYLVSTGALAMSITPAGLRGRSRYTDEGIIIILVLTVGSVALSLGSIFALFGRQEDPGAIHLGLAVVSVLLGWSTLHTVEAFHYAHRYYSAAHDGIDGRRDTRGLVFPGTEEPKMWDFLYHSFVIGMTAQVSDVQATSTAMRRIVMAHGIISFFYNTVLLALAVNLAASRAG
ncbi:MAG: DUF1345 domain-containing protein [Alphaproteobacteria bacterium]|nr:DUF1345 domain-containing protein [Alphaproteobacteria bacterium]